MAGDELTILIKGNLTADPELRFTPSGAAVVNFSVASTPRIFDKSTNEWRDGETVFNKCFAWRELAENITESMVRGTRVTGEGKLVTKKWNDKESGEQRSRMEIEVLDLGPSLKMATAKVTKVQRNKQGGGQSAPQGGTAAQDDPWGGGGNAAPAAAAPAAAEDDPWG